MCRGGTYGHGLVADLAGLGEWLDSILSIFFHPKGLYDSMQRLYQLSVLYYIQMVGLLIINSMSFFGVLNFVVTQIQLRYSSRYLVMLT